MEAEGYAREKGKTWNPDVNKFKKWMARLSFEMKMVWNNIQVVTLFRVIFLVRSNEYVPVSWVVIEMLMTQAVVSGGVPVAAAAWTPADSISSRSASIHGSVFGETTPDQWKDNKSFAELTAVSTPSARLVRLSLSLRHLLPLAWTRQPSPITDLSRRSFLVLLFFNFKAALP